VALVRTDSEELIDFIIKIMMEFDDHFSLMIEAILSSEKSSATRATRRHITEHGILQADLYFPISAPEYTV
jgi:hypothetical protein